MDEAIPIQFAPPLPRAMTAKGDTDANVSALTAGMARCDEAAYRDFYNRYCDRLLRYLLVVTREEEAAREALQQTLVRVVRHARRFDNEPAFWSWLTVLARSSVVDERRKHLRRLAFLDRFFEHSAANDSASEGKADSALFELLEHELGGLAADERELIESKYFGGESTREIADALQTSEKAVESRLARLRRKLKSALLARLKCEETN